MYVFFVRLPREPVWHDCVKTSLKIPSSPAHSQPCFLGAPVCSVLRTGHCSAEWGAQLLTATRVLWAVGLGGG